MGQKTEECKPYVVVKIRGTISAQKEARETLTFLHLTHTNHAVLIDSRASYKGMLQRVNSYVTWGEPTKETVAIMLQKRAKMAGDKKLTEEHIQKAGYKSIDDLAEAIVTCKTEFQKLPDMQPTFRLHPPSKGYKGMLQRVNSYVTWGEPTKETVAMMLQKRAKMAGDKKLTEEHLQKAGYQSIDDLAEAIVTCKTEFQKLPDMQPVFRLHPPSKGYKGKTKKGFKAGGEAGYRGEAINALVQRMV